MTLRGRNRLIRFSLVAILAGGVVLLQLVGVPSRESLRGADAWAMACLVSSLVLATALSGIYIRLFRRTMMVPVFFVILALVATIADVWKIVNLLGPFPGLDGVLTMRLMVISHLVFAFSLFASAVYVSEPVFQRHGVLLLIIVGVAISIAWGLPVDAFTLMPNLLFRTGLGNSVPVTIGVFILLAVITYVQAGYRNHDNRVLVSALAILLLAGGHELLYYGYSVFACVPGIIAMASGGILYAARNYRDEIPD